MQGQRDVAPAPVISSDTGWQAHRGDRPVLRANQRSDAVPILTSCRRMNATKTRPFVAGKQATTFFFSLGIAQTVMGREEGVGREGQRIILGATQYNSALKVSVRR